MAYDLICTVCESEFVAVQPHGRYCSTKCKKLREGEKWGRSSDKTISPGTVGAIAEIAVSVDLMEKGYAVFRALSPSCFCDLIAIKDNKYIRVEVRTGYKGTTGKVSFPLIPRDIDRQDIFAVYIRSLKEVEYFNPSKESIQI